MSTSSTTASPNPRGTAIAASTQPHLEPHHAGTAVHRIIGDLLLAGERSPSFQTILQAVNANPAVTGATTRRQAAKQRLLTSTSCYFRFFSPPEEWEFVSRETTVGAVRLDLLFSTPAGLRSDEIKTGPVVGREAHLEHDKQLQAQIIAGAEHLEDFIGVRACLLMSPSRSFFLTTSGKREVLS